MNKKRTIYPIFLIAWVLAIIFAFIVNLHILRSHSEDLVLSRAEDYFNVMNASKKRDARFGFMYVPVSDDVQPSPYLEHLYRDIVTSRGDTVTLVNPAANMNRKMLNFANQYNITVIRVTCSNPLNPDNLPDEWEAEALKTLKNKDDRVFEKTEKDGVTTYRYMAPLVIEQSCIACHAQQNLKIGDINGGVSISTEFNRSFDTLSEKLLITYSLVFFAGVFLFMFFGIAYRKRKNELEEKNQELKHLNVAKDKFISVMAHDLKTPAANIKSLSEMLMNNFDELGEEERKNCVEMLVESATTHSIMLNSLLDMARLRLGSKQFEPVKLDLRKITNTVLEQTKLQAQQKQIRIVTRIEDFLTTGDKSMITTVIRNLVVNSIKFSHKGGLIVINARGDEKEVTISVADNGVGIPDAKQPRIFKIDANKSAIGTANETGTGLGLLLCKEYVEQHGGNIWFISKEDKGTTFFFTLPIKSVESKV